jgi:hypothetical protein
LLFDRHELLLQPSVFSYLDVSARQQQIELKPGSLAYTICQTPVILQISNEMQIAVFLADGSVQHVEGNVLDTPNSRHIFLRDGLIHHLIVSFPIAGPTGIPEN